MKRVMKKIEVAKTAGFCFGVNRAVEMTYKLVDSGKKVATFGPLIHNPVVIEDLEKKGVRVINSPIEASADTTVVVRTHGVGASVYRSLEATGADVCDATCPFVKKIHRIVGENSSPDIPRAHRRRQRSSRGYWHHGSLPRRVLHFPQRRRTP